MSDKENKMTLDFFMSQDWIMRALTPTTPERALETQEERNARAKKEFEEYKERMLNKRPWEQPMAF